MIVSIVIATLNRRDLLSTTLQSIAGLHIPSGIEAELVVVDNGSDDGTAQVVRGFRGPLRAEVVFEEVKGLARARNTGVSRCAGDIVLITDDDVQLDKQWLASMVDAVQKHGADLMFGRIYPWWERSRPSWYSPSVSGYFGVIDPGDQLKISDPSGPRGFGANHGFRKSAFEALGGYDATLGLRANRTGGGEDDDLFIRAYTLGLRVVYQPASVVHHFIPEERSTKRYLRRREKLGAPDYYRLLQNSPGPTMMGLPRFMFSRALENAALWTKACVTFHEAERFFRGLRLRQFVYLLRESWRQRAERLD